MSAHLQRAIENLMKQLVELSALAEENVKQSLQALFENDIELARKVIELDRIIDIKEIEIEEECLKIFALHQPVAVDLRYLVAALKINNDLERVGDLAQNIAYDVIDILNNPIISKPTDFDFIKIYQKVELMLKKSLDSIVNLNLEKAYEILKEDDDVDRMHWKFTENIMKELKKEPEKADVFHGYLNIVRNLERIADHATNIAEDVIYLIEGEIVRHNKSL